MYFTDGKLRPYEQLMRQSPRRPSSSNGQQMKSSSSPSAPRSSIKPKKEKSHEND